MRSTTDVQRAFPPAAHNNTNELPQITIIPGAHNPKGRSVILVIPPVVKWHLQENSIYGMPSSLVYYATSAKCAYVGRTYHIRSFVQVPFDNRWNQHTYTSLTLLPFGLWAPDYTHACTIHVRWQGVDHFS